MCEAMSLAAAGSSILGGFAEGDRAMASAEFQAGQYKVAGLLAEADGARQKGRLRREFAEARERNMAAAAVSGLAPESFASVMEGNRAEEQRALGQISTSVANKQQEMSGRARVAMMQGRSQRAAAISSGMMGAIGQVWQAETSYRDSHMGESRWEFMRRSWTNPSGRD